MVRCRWGSAPPETRRRTGPSSQEEREDAGDVRRGRLRLDTDRRGPSSRDEHAGDAERVGVGDEEGDAL